MIVIPPLSVFENRLEIQGRKNGGAAKGMVYDPLFCGVQWGLKK